MAVLAIKCPTCGSAAASTTNPNEYECSHCRSKFQIIRPSDATVVTDSRTHHCPICGRTIQTYNSFRCTECGKEDFCDNCGTTVPSFGTHRFVCRACVHQKGWACRSCGDYGFAVCISCKRRACSQRLTQMFGLTHTRNGKSTVQYFNCQTCGGALCST
jgi:DNA-directed RNA polymerase subunit RPC12/RpoP